MSFAQNLVRHSRKEKLGGNGATGGGTDEVFFLNDTVVTQPFTIPAGKNAISAGPLTLADGVDITIEDGGNWIYVE